MTYNLKKYNEVKEYLFCGQGGIKELKSRHFVRQVLRCLAFGERIDPKYFDWLDQHGYLSFDDPDDEKARLVIDDNEPTIDIILMTLVFEGKLDRAMNEKGIWSYKMSKKGIDEVEKKFNMK